MKALKTVLGTGVIGAMLLISGAAHADGILRSAGALPPDDATYPLLTRGIYGLDPKACRRVRGQPGSIIFTKSGGVHGIENPDVNGPPLRFVAFLYHST